MFDANREYRTIFINFCIDRSLDAEMSGFDIPAHLMSEWRAALQPLMDKMTNA